MPAEEVEVLNAAAHLTRFDQRDYRFTTESGLADTHDGIAAIAAAVNRLDLAATGTAEGWRENYQQKQWSRT